MRVILLLLAAYAFVGWNDANAACQRFKPDGSVEACQHMAPGAAPAGRLQATGAAPAGRLQATGAAREYIARECAK